MASETVFDALVRPLLTERSAILQEKHNQYVFQARPEATKAQIREAVERLFKVDVSRVRTMIVAGKYRRMGRGAGYRSDWKKAVVTLKPGQKIDLAQETS